MSICSIDEWHAKEVLSELTEFFAVSEFRYDHGIRRSRHIVNRARVGKLTDRLLHLYQLPLGHRDFS